MNTPRHYKTKINLKEAIQWTGKNLEAVHTFAGDALQPIERRPDYMLKIKTLEGILDVPLYHFIVKGIQGEIYSCEPIIFNNSYEEIR